MKSLVSAITALAVIVHMVFGCDHAAHAGGSFGHSQEVADQGEGHSGCHSHQHASHPGHESPAPESSRNSEESDPLPEPVEHCEDGHCVAVLKLEKLPAGDDASISLVPLEVPGDQPSIRPVDAAALSGVVHDLSPPVRRHLLRHLLLI